MLNYACFCHCRPLRKIHLLSNMDFLQYGFTLCKQTLVNKHGCQLVWIGISFGISITISMLVPFPISLVVIVGTFLLLNFYLRRRMMARMGTSIMGGMFSPTTSYGSSAVKYYCMSCGTQHKQIACPKCGSKMRRIG